MVKNAPHIRNSSKSPKTFTHIQLHCQDNARTPLKNNPPLEPWNRIVMATDADVSPTADSTSSWSPPISTKTIDPPHQESSVDAIHRHTKARGLKHPLYTVGSVYFRDMTVVNRCVRSRTSRGRGKPGTRRVFRGAPFVLWKGMKSGGERFGTADLNII